MTGKCKDFAMMTSFDHGNIDLGSPNLHLYEYLYRPIYSPNFVFPTLTVAEIAGEGEQILTPPPSSARDSQTLSRERVKV